MFSVLCFREDESKGTNSSNEDSNMNSVEDTKSDGGSWSKSQGGGSDSNTRKELGPSSCPEEELQSQVKDTHPRYI